MPNLKKITFVDTEYYFDDATLLERLKQRLGAMVTIEIIPPTAVEAESPIPTFFTKHRERIGAKLKKQYPLE